MIEYLMTPTPAELDALTDLWEASVRATHDFLAPEDIPFFRETVRRGALPAVKLYVVRETGDGSGTAGQPTEPDGSVKPEGSCISRAPGGFAAFAGVAGDMLEMLFVTPAMRGKGLGRELVEYLVRHAGVRRVDVNEQNPQARGFYERMGFRVTGRDATDPSGKPYPILHMELGHDPYIGLVPIPCLLIDRIDVDFQMEVSGTDTEKKP